jgi:putative ABC transport system permease protein
MTDSSMDRPREMNPPKAARWLLEWLLPEKIREFVMGDLEEEFQRLVHSNSGLRFARKWYWRQVAEWVFQTKRQSTNKPEQKLEGDGAGAFLWSDTKYGVRALLKRPVFLVVALLTLALGIGATTAIFSAVNAVILKPLPFPDSDRIVTVWENNLKDGIERDDVSPANFLDWQERQQVFDTMATFNPWSLAYTGGTEPETWLSALVSRDFFEILGVKPAYGRTFLPQEYQVGHNNVVVLSYRFWQRRFGGDRSIIGATLSLDGKPTLVVGVMPPEFRLHFQKPNNEVFQPQVMEEDWKFQRKATYLAVIGRLKPEVTLDQAQSAMETISFQLATEHPQTNSGVKANIVALREHLVGKVRLGLFVLLATVGFVLLIGSANLANLQLARCSERQREIAIRLAMGASRWRIVRQLMLENLILALCGCVAGLLVAKWAIRMIVLVGPDIPRMDLMRLDPMMSGFALILSFLSVLLFGFLPALYVSRFDLQHSLKEGAANFLASGRSGKRLRDGLVISQIAIAIVMLIGAGLFSRSLINLLNVNPGFVRKQVVALQIFLYDRYEKPEQQLNFTTQAISRLKRVKGVAQVGVTTALPFFDSSSTSSVPVAIVGQPVTSGEERTVFRTITTEDYFRVMRIPLQRGRLFNKTDHENGPFTTVINEAMARRLNLGENAVGNKIQVQSRSKVIEMEIIGVVGSLRHEGLDHQQRPEFYVPYGKSPSGAVIFVVRTSTDPGALTPSLKKAIWEVDRSLPFYRITTLEQLVEDSLTERRFHVTLLGSFAVLALCLCAIGIYGLISFITAQRTNEIGLRMALGAQRPDILKMITTHGIRLALTGIITGIVGAFFLARYLETLLFEIRPLDPITYFAVAAILMTVAILACLLPARRATRIDPIIALRCE